MLVAPMNMNYHTAHHLWPSIPYYNLPTADRLMREHPGAAGLEWRGSYFAYLLTYWLALPIAECKQAR
jgi:fatty acid desaturase